MGAAAEGEVVDVGVSACGPVKGCVVGLAAVAGHGAAGEGAAAVAFVHDDALVGVGDAFGAAQPQGASVGFVEQGQVVVAVAGHPDEVGDREAGAGGGDADTGDVIWEVEYEAPGDLDYGNSPRATPLVHNGRVILLGAMGDLRCVTLATGETNWKRHLVRDFAVPKAAVSAWGYCSSPLIADDRLVVSPGAPDAAVVALDPVTGAELWRAPGHPAGYGSFVATVVGGRRQVIGFDAQSLGGWEVATGRRIWEWKPPLGGGFNVPTPVLFPGEPVRVLISNETDGTVLFAFNDDGRLLVESVASSEDLSAEMATPVAVGRHVIGTQDRLVALDAADALRTLTTLEEPSLATYAAVIAGPASVLTVGNGGRLALYDVTKDGCRLNSTTTVLPASESSGAQCPVYSHPAIVGTRLYIRGSHDLVCVDLAIAEEAD